MGKQTRFSLALDFACAAVAVLMSGHVADEMLRRTKPEDPPSPSEVPAKLDAISLKRKVSSQTKDDVQAELSIRLRDLRTKILRIDQKEMARRLGVSQSMISQWESGKLPSKMSLIAIGKISDDPTYWYSQAGIEDGSVGFPFVAEARPHINTELLRRKLYRGMIPRVARSLGMSRQHVWEVANERRSSSRVEAALKAEYKRIDEEVENAALSNRERAAE